MCGGYYEEEMIDMKFTTAEDMMKDYYGPSTIFRTTPEFGKAAVVCEMENISCRLDPLEKAIHFENAEAEQNFMIAWGKIVAGSLNAESQ